MKTHKSNKIRKRNKVRSAIVGSSEIPRLSVYKSNKYIYVQAVNDMDSKTVASASSLNMKDIKKPKMEQSFEVGKSLGEILKKNKVEKAVFDRGYYKYHGRVKQLADGIRKAGIKF